MTTNKKLYFISIIVILSILGGWYLTYYLLVDDENRGTFGDMFGSVNALFSGFALAGIIFTILLQKNELSLQREELKETRKEFQTQNETLKIQRFENTFFNLLSLHHQIVEGIDFRRIYNKKMFSMEENPDVETVTLTGRDVFEHLYSNLKNDLESSSSLQEIERAYTIHYSLAQADFGHYFRNLYRIIKLVDSTDFQFGGLKRTPEEIYYLKYQYTSIVRAQLSDFELLWLFYNSLTFYGAKFKPLIEKYTLLKNIPMSYIADAEHQKYFNKDAFHKNSRNE